MVSISSSLSVIEFGRERCELLSSSRTLYRLRQPSGYQLVYMALIELFMPYFSNSSGPFIASTRPYFLFRVAMS